MLVLLSVHTNKRNEMKAHCHNELTFFGKHKFIFPPYYYYISSAKLQLYIMSLCITMSIRNVRNIPSAAVY